MADEHRVWELLFSVFQHMDSFPISTQKQKHLYDPYSIGLSIFINLLTLLNKGQIIIYQLGGETQSIWKQIQMIFASPHFKDK